MSEPAVRLVQRNGTKVSEFIQPNVEYVEWTTNEPGGAAFDIDPIINAEKTFGLVQYEIQIWDDDDLVWWGVPWRAEGDSKRMKVICEGLPSYFRKRYVDRMSLLYTSIEQRTIAWNLVDYAQNESVQAYRDLNIDAATFSGTTHIRSRNYLRNDHAMILDLLQEFPTLEDGFDWDITYNATGQRLWTPYYPRKGSTKNNLKLVWSSDGHRKDLVGWTFIWEGAGIVTHAYKTGGTSGDVKFENNYEDTTASAQFGVMQAVSSDGSQNDVNWLLEAAQRQVNQQKNTIKIPSVRLNRYVTAPDGSTIRDYLFDVVDGDTLPVRLDCGLIQYDGSERIKTKRWEPSSDEIVLTFNQAA